MNYTYHLRPITVVADSQEEADEKLYDLLVSMKYEITSIDEYEVI